MANNELAWRGFTAGKWMSAIDCRDFIQLNYSPYDGNTDFLTVSTTRTTELWEKCKELLEQEHDNGGVLAVEGKKIITVTSYAAGYIDKEREIIVGLQTDAPLKRSINPFGGIRMAEDACAAYGCEVDSQMSHFFTEYRKTHNQGVFDAYTQDIKNARKCGVITGLPDAYGRGRIIGDYRRLPLYGLTFLIEGKKNDLEMLSCHPMDEDNIRNREELAGQIKALHQIGQMAMQYGYDIANPAQNAREAFQWLYFAYLAAIKEQNGAAMSLGRVSTFLDIYVERDIKEGILDEAGAQELVEHFIIKLRLARHLRTPEYNELFAGDPMWITESIGGIGEDGRPLVTRSSYRFLHSLINLGPAPEPNLTVLWSMNLPDHFKEFCAEVSRETSALQYENDDLMRPYHGDDYGIACCVSAMTLGKQMQLFGARCNLPKALLLAINEGRDELSGQEIVPGIPLLRGEFLDSEEVYRNFDKVLDWVSKTYVDALNIIHYMHDKYAYESVQMAMHDSRIDRLMAFGLAGLSVTVDSLSAIAHNKIKPVRNNKGITESFEGISDFPAFGNDEDSVDGIAVELVNGFLARLRSHTLYRNAVPTLSILTITSNVVYGKKTGMTPDGRKKGEPFAPGANPMSGREKNGMLASLNSVAKLPYNTCRDGISYTLNMGEPALGKNPVRKNSMLAALIDGYFARGGHHLNINVISRDKLQDAMNHPEKYPNLTVRVSGYAVHFSRLSEEQKKEVLQRSFH